MALKAEKTKAWRCNMLTPSCAGPQNGMLEAFSRSVGDCCAAAGLKLWGIVKYIGGKY
jgi:hypothetical protein